MFGALPPRGVPQPTKESLYSFINVVGLATGIACSSSSSSTCQTSSVTTAFIRRPNKPTGSMNSSRPKDGSGERSASIPFPMGEALMVEYPGMVKEVRFFDFQSPNLTVAYEPDEKQFNERNFYFVDSTYHKVFSLPLAKATYSPHSTTPTP